MLAALTAALTLAAPAPATPPGQHVHRLPAGADTPAERVEHYRRTIAHCDSVFRFFERHPKLVYAKATRRRVAAILRRHRTAKVWAASKLISLTAISRRVPHLELWLCIHSGIKGGTYRGLRYLGGGERVHPTGEGSWTDPNAPYYGGLQMGWWFMRTFGSDLLASKGTAERWTPIEQMLIAERAIARMGLGSVHSQWPNTGPPCL